MPNGGTLSKATPMTLGLVIALALVLVTCGWGVTRFASDVAVIQSDVRYIKTAQERFVEEFRRRCSEDDAQRVKLVREVATLKAQVEALLARVDAMEKGR